MTLTSGSRLGSYEVLSAIGAGGMGEVYRARDSKLNRDVALKILPEVFASDPERLARFRREAQVLASLNHPGIAAIYGFEESDGTQALVLELVEGPTIADRIAQGSIPLDEALPIARQIAEALEAAHEQGIIHRDLKPANIKLRPDGTVKVLDFGLAKALAGDGAAAMSGNVSMSPTLTTPVMTNVGMIMGTAAYMAPEQAKGRTVDKRSDVWAFACVLFEMLAGVRAFDGDDIAEALASVIKTEPDWTKLPPDTPRAVHRLLRQCLRKDPKQRIPDISVARFELAEVMAGAEPQDGPRIAARDAASTWRTRTLALVAAAAVALGAAVATTWTWLRPKRSPLSYVHIQRSDGRPIGLAGPAAELDISPDGRNIVYIVGGAPNVQQMYLQALGQLEPQSFPNIGNPIYPVFSPTGDWIAFFDLASRTIRKVQASGGSPVTIAPRSNAAIRGMSWASDDTIVFGTGDPATGVMRVSAAGGTPEVLTKPDGSKGESGHWFPHPLPDGRGVLFTVAASPAPNVEDLRTAVFNSRTGEYRTILTGAFSARYVPTGHIVYATAGGTLRAARFNLDRLEVVGQGVPVVEQVITKQSGALSANVSSNGTLAYLRGVAAGSERSLAWIDRDGREEPILAPIRAYAYPRLSPDGTRVALDIRDQENDTWIWDLNRKTLTRLTFDPGPNRGVVWSPDGKHIAFSAQRDGVETIHWQSADGTGAPEKLTEGTQSQFPSAFTPDGQFLLFQEPAAAPRDIYLLNLADGKVQPLLASPKFNEDNPQVSPNGRWLAYESNQSGRDDIYVRPFPNVDGAGGVLVSTGGGTQPLWSRTGKELFYLVRPSTIMAVPVDIATPSFSAGNPEAVVNGGFMAPPFSGLSYSVSPDGKRFLVIKDPRTSSAPPQLVLAFNWLEELERLVP